MSAITDLETLAGVVPSGASLGIGGFQLNRVPVALLRAIAARRTTDLTSISAPNPLALEILVAAGCLRAAECGFTGFQYEHGFVVPPAVRRGLASGDVALRQPDVYETIESLRRAAESGARPTDFTLLHAQRADLAGNLQIDDVHLDLLLAAAGGPVLATVETLVDLIETPSVRADRVQAFAVVEQGAAPTSCAGRYDRDDAAIRELLGEPPPSASKAPAAVAPPEHAAAVDALLAHLARQVRDREVIATGVASAMPMLAIELARRTHAPRLQYLNCVGAVNPRIDSVLASSVDAGLLDRCDARIDLPDLFDLARRGGVDAMFFGAAQIDAAGNVNLTRVNGNNGRDIRLPGPAGSPSMRSWVRRVLLLLPRQRKRNLVARVDEVTSAPASRNRETVVVTDLAVWRLGSGGLTPASLHRGVSPAALQERTGFPIVAEAGVPEPLIPQTPDPTEAELGVLAAIDPEGRRHDLFTSRRPLHPRQPTPEGDAHEV